MIISTRRRRWAAAEPWNWQQAHLNKVEVKE